jgi:hypothetical protein
VTVTQRTEPCVRSCALYGRHLAACEARDTCRGCLPRRAAAGRLCWPCHRRLELMLTDSATVWRWLTGNMTAGEGAARAREDFERVAGSGDGAPTPVKLAVLDVRDELAAFLAGWAAAWAGHQGVTVPTPHTPAVDAAFLLLWLRGVEEFDDIGTRWDRLAELLRDAHVVAPWRPVLRRVSGVACPECGEVNLVIHGGESDVSCLSCRTLIPEAWFGLWEQIVRDHGDDGRGRDDRGSHTRRDPAVGGPG